MTSASVRPGLSQRWHALEDWVRWTSPTAAEVAVVLKAGAAASVAWWVASTLMGLDSPVLASLVALITIRVSVRTSLKLALQRSSAVVLGVLTATAFAHVIGLNALTVGLLTAGSLALAQLVLRLPRPAATQLPVSVLAVMTAVASGDQSSAWHRVIATLLGAGVGAVVTVTWPTSRVADSRETVGRVGTSLGRVLDSMGAGLLGPWDSTQTEEWRRRSRVARDRLVDEAREAVGDGRDEVKWNLRDRRFATELGRYEQSLPHFAHAAIGVAEIARGLDDHAQLVDSARPPVADVGQLLNALGALVRAVTEETLGSGAATADARAQVRLRREQCAQAARESRDFDEATEPSPGLGWLSYAALLVQVDRIVQDLPGGPQITR